MEKDFELSKLVNMVPDMVCIASTDGYFKYLNIAWQKMLGYTVKELLSKPLFEFIHPDDIEPTRRKIQQQVDGENVKGFINRYRTREGSYRILEWRATPAAENKIFAIARDVTERTKNEKAIKKSEKQLRFVLETLEMVAVSLDEEGNIIFCNDYLLRLTGWSRGEILGKHWIKTFIPPEMQDGIEQDILQKTFQIGMFPPRYQNPILTKDGDCKLINWSNTTLVDSQGKTICVTSIGEDITERKQIEDTLKLNANRYLNAQKIAHVGNWEYDITTGKIWCSEEARKIYGIPDDSEEFKLDQVEKYIIDRERVHQALLDLIEKDTPYKIEFEIFATDNKRKIIKSIAEVTRNSSGEPLKACGVILDITEQKEAENKAIQYKNQLRKLNAYIQNAMEQERISIAREIHDDLGQTLTALKMDLGWLEKRTCDNKDATGKKIGEMKKIIDDSVTTIKRLCSDLRPGILDDLGLVAALGWYIDQFSKRSGIKCTLHVEPEDFEADKKVSTCIYRIVQEALTNVSRHAQATKMKVSLSNELASITLSICDNGRGGNVKQFMSTQSFGVLGMKERAASLNGNFEVLSQPGKGTIVKVALPLETKEIREV